jgi:hypothetical protein
MYSCWCNDGQQLGFFMFACQPSMYSCWPADLINKWIKNLPLLGGSLFVVCLFVCLFVCVFVSLLCCCASPGFLSEGLLISGLSCSREEVLTFGLSYPTHS